METTTTSKWIESICTWDNRRIPAIFWYAHKQRKEREVKQKPIHFCRVWAGVSCGTRSLPVAHNVVCSFNRMLFINLRFSSSSSSRPKQCACMRSYMSHTRNYSLQSTRTIAILNILLLLLLLRLYLCKVGHIKTTHNWKNNNNKSKAIKGNRQTGEWRQLLQQQQRQQRIC